MLRGLQCVLSGGTGLNKCILKIKTRAVEMAQHGSVACTLKLTKPLGDVKCLFYFR